MDAAAKDSQSSTSSKFLDASLEASYEWNSITKLVLSDGGDWAEVHGARILRIVIPKCTGVTVSDLSECVLGARVPSHFVFAVHGEERKLTPVGVRVNSAKWFLAACMSPDGALSLRELRDNKPADCIQEALFSMKYIPNRFYDCRPDGYEVPFMPARLQENLGPAVGLPVDRPYPVVEGVGSAFAHAEECGVLESILITIGRSAEQQNALLNQPQVAELPEICPYPSIAGAPPSPIDHREFGDKAGYQVLPNRRGRRGGKSGPMTTLSTGATRVTLFRKGTKRQRGVPSVSQAKSGSHGVPPLSSSDP
jgi:hypothetical protein